MAVAHSTGAIRLEKKMSVAPEPDWQHAQAQRLQRFLRWLIPFAAVFMLLEGLAFLFFHDAALGIASLTTVGCLGGFLLAQAQLRQGRLQRAAIILYTVMLGSALVGSFVFPNLLPMRSACPRATSRKPPAP
jgi:hypothetical protein